MSYKDIAKKSDKELVELVQEKRESIRDFRFSNTGGAVRDVRQARANRKEIAQALTELNVRAKAKLNKDDNA